MDEVIVVNFNDEVYLDTCQQGGNSAMSSIEFGAPESEAARTAVRDFAERCRRAGFAAEMVGDVRGALWNKLIGLASNAALTSAARLPAGPLYTDPDVVEVATALVAEATAVARAQGVASAAGHRADLDRPLQAFSAGHVCLDVPRHRQRRADRS